MGFFRWFPNLLVCWFRWPAGSQALPVRWFPSSSLGTSNQQSSSLKTSIQTPLQLPHAAPCQCRQVAAKAPHPKQYVDVSRVVRLGPE